MSLAKRFGLIQVRTKVKELVHQQIVNQALLGKTKHQFILGAFFQLWFNANNEGVLVLS